MSAAPSGGLAALSGIVHAEGYCFVAELPAVVPEGDASGVPAVSNLRVFEDERELGPGRQMHAAIGEQGGGRFSHWGRMLYFSASDNTDPTTNGRSYRVAFRRNETAAAALFAAVADVDPARLDEEGRYSWGERLFEVFNPGQHPGERSRSYFADGRFRADYKRVEPDNYRSFDRKFAMKELFKLALPLTGDLAECGVYRGGSAFFLAQAIRLAGARKRLHLFDSFEGVSEPLPGLDGDHWRKGHLACDQERVAATLNDFADLVSFHAGWIPDRFTDVADRRFCFVHIDVDLYQPTADALAFFVPRMTPGGLILCDDYGFETCPGARRAMDDCGARNGLPVVHLPTGQGLIVIGGHDMCARAVDA